MPSHDHPHFSAPHFEPSTGGWAPRESREFDSMNVAEELPARCATCSVPLEFGAKCMRCVMAELDKKLAPVDPVEILRQAEAELGVVVRYGLSQIADAIDREHIATAHALISLVLNANKGRAA